MFPHPLMNWSHSLVMVLAVCLQVIHVIMAMSAAAITVQEVRTVCVIQMMIVIWDNKNVAAEFAKRFADLAAV